MENNVIGFLRGLGCVILVWTAWGVIAVALCALGLWLDGRL